MNITNCTSIDMTLMVDSFEHFQITTLISFDVDPIHYITALQMAYFLFLKIRMESDHGE